MKLSLNARALAIAERMAADAEALRVAVLALPNGTRLIDCGSSAPGGLEAGRLFAEACLGGLGQVGFTSVEIAGRWLPALTVRTDDPALACLGSQYAGWSLQREGYFAMASGPGRALIRAEELYGDLDCDERSEAALLCLESRALPEPAVAGYVAERAGVAPGALTLLLAPTASLAGGVQVAARVVETALHKLHALKFDVRRVVSGFGTCPLPPVARSDGRAIGRTNDAVLYGGRVELVVAASDDELEDLVVRLPSSVSPDYGQPFYETLKRAEFDFYKIDPMLFSPAQVRLCGLTSGRAFEAGSPDGELLARSFWEG
jgi:methenyltetrahydromethanopterin cyclohydrolase